MDYRKFLSGLLNALIRVRTQTRSISDCHRWGFYGNVQGRLVLAHDLDLITLDQYVLLADLLSNAHEFQGNPFPGDAIFGPVMPRWIASGRALELVKPQAEVPADVPQVSRPAPSSGVRLLCVLDQSRTGEATRSFPICTMRPMPPRVGPQGRWSLGHNSGFHLRETHAKPAPASLMARGFQHGQAHAVCTDTRAV